VSGPKKKNSSASALEMKLFENPTEYSHVFENVMENPMDCSEGNTVMRLKMEWIAVRAIESRV
jgi:hypothetical protein